METIDEYLTALASEHPTPGGGSAATLVAACGSALVGMVARICAGNPKYAAHRDLAGQIGAQADQLRVELDQARERDERAFRAVMEASSLPKDTANRRELIEAALREAAAEPLHAARLCLAIQRLAAQLLEIPNKNLASDVGCAAEFAAAALAACAYNVRINHRFMKDTQTVEAQANVLARYERVSSALLAAIRLKLHQG